jgi:hypothetical protein
MDSPPKRDSGGSNGQFLINDKSYSKSIKMGFGTETESALLAI